MAHTSAHGLKDISSELDLIRSLNGLKEKGAGIFYYKSIPFLHFHDKDGVRWADVKVEKMWVKVDIDFDPSRSVRECAQSEWESYEADEGTIISFDNGWPK